MSELKNADQQAYPSLAELYKEYQGLTKRELFAAMALQGLVAKEGSPDDTDWMARNAVLLADALLDELRN